MFNLMHLGYNEDVIMVKLKSKFQISTQKYSFPEKLEKYVRGFTDEEIKEWLEEDKWDGDKPEKLIPCNYNSDSTAVSLPLSLTNSRYLSVVESLL